MSRESPQTVPPPIIEDQGDRLGQALTRLRFRSPLSVRARNLRAIRDEPLAIALDHRGELVPQLSLRASTPHHTLYSSFLLLANE
jgi:hypothetical protein